MTTPVDTAATARQSTAHHTAAEKARQSAAPTAPCRGEGVRRSLAHWLESPLATYYVLVGSTIALVAFGLVMVLSASSIDAYESKGSIFAVFGNQALFAIIGTVTALVATRIPVRGYRLLAVPALLAAIGLQALVFTGMGVTVNGNRNWLALGPVSIQPSELAKIALILVGAVILAKKRTLLGRYRHVVVPFLVPIAVLVIGLVLRGHDLGTSLILLAIVAAVLFAAGVPTRAFVGAALAAGAVVAAFVFTSEDRMGRITTWLSASCSNPDSAECGQTVHGLFALADGGWWGVGLGASREKQGWLPSAHNDFIFAVIGEELGLPGTLSVLILFAMLAWACYRLVLGASDQFVRIATVGVMAWVMVQAIVNIGTVIGLLPVIGVPLPLVSAGGSALVTTMAALGMLISFARAEPAAAEALRARPGVVRRSLAVLPRRGQGRS